MDKTVEIVEFLQDWQDISYEQVETASEIKIFNIIGVIIQLVKNGYMPITATHTFISGILSLTEEEKESILKVINNAYESVITIN